jgi:hypothetical protein
VADVIRLALAPGRWSSGPMLIMGVFSAALYVAHPELNPAQGFGLLTELSAQSCLHFVSVDRFICQEFDDHYLLAFHDTIIQTSLKVM